MTANTILANINEVAFALACTEHTLNYNCKKATLTNNNNIRVLEVGSAKLDKGTTL